MSNEQEGLPVERRAGMRQIQAELGRLSEQFGRLVGEFAGIKNALERADKDIAELRSPQRQPLIVQGGIAVFLLTVISLLYAGQMHRIEGLNEASELAFQGLHRLVEDHESRGREHKAHFRTHVADGHSREQARDMLEHGMSLLRFESAEMRHRIATVDQRHADEHIEQEEDISALRERDQLTEHRLFGLTERVAVIETKFGRVVGHGPDGFHQKDWRQVSAPIFARLDYLEQKILQK